MDILWTLFWIWIGYNAAFIAWTVFDVREHVPMWLRVKWGAAAMLGAVVRFVAIPLVPVAVLTAKRVGERAAFETVDGTERQIMVPAYRMRRIFRWLETHDDGDGLLPGGTYETIIQELYGAGGWRLASIWWLLRNRAYRFLNSFRVEYVGQHWVYEDGNRRLVLLFADKLNTEVTAFELNYAWKWLPGGRSTRYKAGYKLSDYVDGDGLVGGATGILQPPSLRLAQVD